MSWQLLLITVIQFGVPFLIIFVYVVAMMLPLLIYMERKASAYMQDRRGPNRASIAGIRAFGLVHLVADVLKLLMKEDVEPTASERFTFRLAPFLVMAAVILIMGAIPFGEPVDLGRLWGYEVQIEMQAVNINAGILFVFAVASLEVYGLILGGYSAANKYSFLGALRGASQMISYEVTLGLAVVGILLVYGSADLQDIVLSQGANPLNWGLVISPLGFLLFWIAIFAETNRNPFDLPEAESEIVAGYHLEYSSFKFALFFMGEYASMAVSSAILVTLFVGGWQVPFLDRVAIEDNAALILRVLCFAGMVALAVGGLAILNGARSPRIIYKDRRDLEPKIFTAVFFLGALALGAAAVALPSIDFAHWMTIATRVLVQAVSFMAKTFFFAFCFIWVRWTLPRFRYDQLMRVGWRWMLPIGLANILVTYVWGVEVLGR
jgi:NADH-quinone oxidoreductase subunit H